MRIPSILPALMIGAGLLLPTQTPAQAKTTTYKVKKFKKFKGSKKFKGGKKFKSHAVKHTAPKHKAPKVVRH